MLLSGIKETGDREGYIGIGVHRSYLAFLVMDNSNGECCKCILFGNRAKE